MSYVYIKSQHDDPPLWTVGFYDPQGQWHPESDHTSSDKAAARVAWLNGGWPPKKDGEPEMKPGEVRFVPLTSRFESMSN